jgi:hypothetical protein
MTFELSLFGQPRQDIPFLGQLVVSPNARTTALGPMTACDGDRRYAAAIRGIADQHKRVTS